MDALSVLLGDFDIKNHDPREVETFLAQQLQAKDSYDAYFSSMPLPGSIVEDIAEIEAQISAQERKLRSVLVENKESLCDSLCNGQVEPQLTAMLAQIDQLWELEKPETVENSEQSSGQHRDTLASLYDPLAVDLEEEEEEEEEEPQQLQKPGDELDEFHAALHKLTVRANEGLGVSGSAHDNLALVLAQWKPISELLELPSLTSTCIKTGHYQEALLCHEHARGLVNRFPNTTIVRHISDSISQEITTTMLQGLVKMLQQNLGANAMKKILTYLASIPPFSANPQALTQVFLTMRYKFVCAEMDSFEITELANDTMRELLVKRKIEAFREHVYNALAILQSQSELFNTKHHNVKVGIPLLQESKKPVATNPLTLLYVQKCCDSLIEALKQYKDSLSVSVCLQLVYCSFRLADCNPNYHHLFIKKIHESQLVSPTDLNAAMEKRRELANKYY
ncbi:LAME_0E09186g1_1 [Lachancea meyersii CBS 8951]|uniref:Conserved oligomeric Golgi complex subunit 8 n=1 Tax=Lachancea meyersii CBS 8951 TaxID=1266667 RepID=A0A1G4JJA7_9SACH|nr:LAME_0E09186g1_1 [Lachancea meyersii CBS 8951]